MTLGIVLVALAVILIVALVNRAKRRAEKAISFLLADGREHRGLEIVAQSAGKLKRGTIYVHLGRLEERGVLTSRRDPLSPFPGTRLYRIRREAR